MGEHRSGGAIRARALVAVALLGAATACGDPGAAATGNPAPTVSPTADSGGARYPPPAPGRKPPTLLRSAVDPAGLFVPEGGTARFAVVLTNTEAGPIDVQGVPPAVTLQAADGEAVRTFPGGSGAATIPPGGAYRQEVVWDLRRDDGNPVGPGRYGARLSTFVVRHAGGATNLTMGSGTGWTVVVEPAGGARSGVLPLALAATDQGTALTLDRLVLERTEARLEAHATPAWPNSAAARGSPLGRWTVATDYRLDGRPPVRVPSPGFGVDDPARTTLVWHLDAVPASARELELTVRVSGDLDRHWDVRIPLPAPVAGPATDRTAAPSGPTPVPTAAPPAPPQSRPPPDVWRLSGGAIAADRGFRVARLGTIVQKQPGGPASLAAFVAFVAPAGDQATVAPIAGHLRVLDALGGPRSAVYHEVVRWPGVTVGAVLVRGLPAGRTTLSLEVGALDVVRGPTAPIAVGGAWRIGLVDQLVELPPQAAAGATLPSGKQVVDVGGARVHYAAGFGGVALAVERPGAAPEPVYVLVAADMGGLRPLDRAIGDCYLARLYEPTPVGGGPPPTPTPRPGSPAAGMPAGAPCSPLPAPAPG